MSAESAMNTVIKSIAFRVNLPKTLQNLVLSSLLEIILRECVLSFPQMIVLGLFWGENPLSKIVGSPK